MGQKRLHWYQDIGFSITTLPYDHDQQPAEWLSGKWCCLTAKRSCIWIQALEPFYMRTGCSPCICVGVFLVMQFPPPSVHVRSVNLKSGPLTEAGRSYGMFPSECFNCERWWDKPTVSHFKASQSDFFTDGYQLHTGAYDRSLWFRWSQNRGRNSGIG